MKRSTLAIIVTLSILITLTVVTALILHGISRSDYARETVAEESFAEDPDAFAVAESHGCHSSVRRSSSHSRRRRAMSWSMLSIARPAWP